VIDLDIASTQLLYMQAEHISDKRMIKLSKWDLLYGQKIGELNFYKHRVYGK
jgi:hypothetical protein